MATSAIGSEFVVMNIVRAMATATASVNRFDLTDRAPMAVRAKDVDMRAFEGKLGLRFVIENPKFPGDRVMASVTACREIAAMRVVGLVTGLATGFDIREYLRCVTVLAFVFVVSAQQRKRREIMIEEDRVLPVHFGMAVFAFRTQRLLVNVIVQVTGFASHFEFDVEDRFDVTIIAGRFQMTAKEFVLRIGVVVKEWL